MLKENKIVHGLWIGGLTNLELLTIRSFIHHGHEFHLWLYDSPSRSLPEGTKVKDANQIVPESAIFRYDSKCSIPEEHQVRAKSYGKDSVAGFSDLFRYRLLYEKGGWWSDMDITCLKPLNLTDPYIFKHRPRVGVNGNTMKCPPQSQVMRRCFERMEQEVNRDNVDWLKPLQILADSIQELGLQEFIRMGIGDYDHRHEVEPFLYSNQPVTKDCYVLHWFHEIWRTLELDKNDTRPNTTFGALLRQFNVITPSQEND